MFELATDRASGNGESVLRWWHRGSFDIDHARYLDLIAKFGKDCTGSYRERIAASEQLEAEVRRLRSLGIPEYLQFWGTRLFLPAAKKLVISDASFRAGLRSTIAAIACERFRLRSGRWPNALSEIPADILSAVPSDPFDDQPFRLTRTDEGVKVHSIWTIGEEKHEIGARLWNPADRGKPPHLEVQNP